MSMFELFLSVQDMFEKVNEAYEFLCSRTKVTEGPDPKNIVLILKAQSILFSRYKEGETWLLTSIGPSMIGAINMIYVLIMSIP